LSNLCEQKINLSGLKVSKHSHWKHRHEQHQHEKGREITNDHSRKKN